MNVPIDKALSVPRCIVPELRFKVLCVTVLLKLTVPVYAVSVPVLPIVIVPVGVAASVIVPPKVIDLPFAALRFIVPTL